MTRSGPKKLYEFHFTATEADGARFLALAERLDMVRADVAREAIISFLVVAESAPVDLSRHRLAAWIEDALARLRCPPPGVNGQRQADPAISLPSRASADRKRRQR